MEALGAAASVAGLLSLAAQAITGIIKLRAFAKDIQAAPQIIETFLRDVDSFGGSLVQIRQLLSQLQNERPDVAIKLGLDTLQTQLTSCSDDIEQWLITTKLVDPGTEKGAKAFFRKLRVAADKNGFCQFHDQIARHQRALGISVSVIGPSLSIHTMCDVQSLSTQVHNFYSDSTTRDVQLTSDIQTNIETLIHREIRDPFTRQFDSFEEFSQISFDHARRQSESIQALSDAVSCLSSQMSSLQNAFMYGSSPRLAESQTDLELSSSWPKPELSADWETLVVGQFDCGEIVGIDDGFVDSKCIYCSKEFLECDARGRGLHLVSQHSFGNCEFTTNISSYEYFNSHLKTAHGAVGDHRGPYYYQRKKTSSAISTVASFAILASQQSTNTDFSEMIKATEAQLAILDDEFIRLLHKLDALNVDSIVPNVSEMPVSLLADLWRLKIDIDCLKEGYLIQDAVFPLIANPEIPDHFLSQLGYRLSPLGQQVNTNVAAMQPAAPAQNILDPDRNSLMNAYWGYTWLIGNRSSRADSEKLREMSASFRIQAGSLKMKSESPVHRFKSKVSFFMNTYSGHVDAHCAKTLAPRTLVLPGTKALFQDFDKVIHRLDTDRCGQLVAKELNRTWYRQEVYMERSLRQFDHVNDWLLRILAQSDTARSLISHDSRIRSIEKPQIFPWLLRNLAHWSVESRVANLECCSDGAVHSRENLNSLKSRAEGVLPDGQDVQSLYEGLAFECQNTCGLFKCHHCPKHFSTESLRQLHHESHPTRPLWCCLTVSQPSCTFSYIPSRNEHQVWGCRFCGAEFREAEVDDALPAKLESGSFKLTWTVIYEHMVSSHDFGKCKSATKYDSVEAFRSHLISSHHAVAGEWLLPLEAACRREEPGCTVGADTLGIRPGTKVNKSCEGLPLRVRMVEADTNLENAGNERIDLLVGSDQFGGQRARVESLFRDVPQVCSVCDRVKVSFAKASNEGVQALGKRKAAPMDIMDTQNKRCRDEVGGAR